MMRERELILPDLELLEAKAGSKVRALRQTEARGEFSLSQLRA